MSKRKIIYVKTLSIKTRQFNNKMTALISKHYNNLSISGMAKLWFRCFEYYHAYRSGNTFNERLCVVLEQSLWLDEIPSVTMGSCKSKILNEF